MGARYIDASHFKERILTAAFNANSELLTKAANKICGLVDQEPTAIRWIPVSEDIPRDGNPVYVLTSNKAQFVAKYNHHFDRFACSGSVCITHWMPMLPVPEDGKDG